MAAYKHAVLVVAVCAQFISVPVLYCFIRNTTAVPMDVRVSLLHCGRISWELDFNVLSTTQRSPQDRACFMACPVEPVS